jgi:hypothetical protein
MVFCYQNSRPSASNFKSFSRSLQQLIQAVKGQDNFWQQNAFITCSWRILRYNELEQLELKLEKNIGIYKHAGKVRKKKFLNLMLITLYNSALKNDENKKISAMVLKN